MVVGIFSSDRSSLRYDVLGETRQASHFFNFQPIEIYPLPCASEHWAENMCILKFEMHSHVLSTIGTSIWSANFAVHFPTSTDVYFLICKIKAPFTLKGIFNMYERVNLLKSKTSANSEMHLCNLLHNGATSEADLGPDVPWLKLTQNLILLRDTFLLFFEFTKQIVTCGRPLGQYVSNVFSSIF